MTTPLTLIDTEALITELFSRFDHAVFVGNVRHTEETDEELFRSRGNRRMCEGLCHGAIIMIEWLHKDGARTIPDGEDT